MALKITTLVQGCGLVSQKKKRKKVHGCYYFTDRILAMLFPMERMRAVYKVEKVLEKSYCGHYKAYNLSIEQDNDPSHFENQVERFPFDDIHVPSLPMIKEFCSSVHSWLSRDPENIVVIYCMAGNYQTGLMIFSYLVYSGMLADEALQIFKHKRIKTKLGVAIPSQQRYADYWHKSLLFSLGRPTKVNLPKPCSKEFRRIRLYDTKDIETVFFVVSEMQDVPGQRYRPSAETCRNSCRIYKKGVFDIHHRYSYPFIEEEEDGHDRLDCYFVNTVQVTGDVRVTFYEKGIGGRLFYVCFNTAFIENNSIQFSISELDKVGNKGESIAGPEFYVEFLFGPENPN